ncbi:MAG: hypothetical protein ACRDG3_10630 [Tepidiformaceae bacterium]
MSAHHAARTSHSSLAFEAALRTISVRRWSPEAVRELLERLLDASGLDYDQRVEVLGGALVAESVRPYWLSGNSADAAHELLRRHDGELADVVETLSPVLLARAEARDDARKAVELVQAMLAPTP